MTLLQIAFLALVFLSVAAVVAVALGALAPSAARERLRQLLPAGSGEVASPWAGRASEVAARVGKLSIPDTEWEQSLIRRRLMNAGIRDSGAPILYFGAKTALALALPIVTWIGLVLGGIKLNATAMLFALLAASAIGYYLPGRLLERRIALRQREIFENFPDALDLMIVCIEAGLGIEAAMARVAEDIEHKSLPLAEELRLVGLELRAGSDRERALRNLASRTGVEEVETWVTMVVQAERFGTSIASALRVHADMLRTRRRQRAEEEAAKIALQLLFPLIFCIFPSLMLVLLGPAFIQIYRVLLPSIGGGH